MIPKFVNLYVIWRTFQLLFTPRIAAFYSHDAMTENAEN